MFLKSLFLIVGLLTLHPLVPSAAALLLGVFFALFLGNPLSRETKKVTAPLLQLSVVGLGAGMNLDVVLRVGSRGIGYTLISIVLTVVGGLVLGRFLKVNTNTSMLLSVGTAICGGSAIAAVAPVIKAKPHEVSISLATVFFLNALALIIFPPLGHWAGMSQPAFGLWSALAIHDTSSVVGASLQYGREALEIATTIKLARALWIVPVTLAAACVWSRRATEATQKTKKPWFILGFLIMAALVTYIPQIHDAGHWVSEAARRLLVLTLFLIGSGLTRETLRSVGLRPMIQGAILWVLVGGTTLGLIASHHLG